MQSKLNSPIVSHRIVKPPMCPMPQLLRKYATHHAIIKLSILATKNAATVSWNELWNFRSHVLSLQRAKVP